MKYVRIEKIQENLAYIITIGMFLIDLICIYKIVDKSITEGVKIVLGMIFGSLNTGWLLVVGFYFGSSFGSVAKSKVLIEGIEKDDRTKSESD